jgi:hypothetical protein
MMSIMEQRALARANARAAMPLLNGGGRALLRQFNAVAVDRNPPQLNTPVKAEGQRPRGD